MKVLLQGYLFLFEAVELSSTCVRCSGIGVAVPSLGVLLLLVFWY